MINIDGKNQKKVIEDMKETMKAPWERISFLLMITFVGGYMNAYTYVTRDGILANMHTANMSRFGISVANGEWAAAGSFFAPILACIFGAAFSELFKKKVELNQGLHGDWRKYALLLEGAVMLAVGMIPLSVPSLPVTVAISFFMGFQLCLFRKFEGTAHNTTICTGNLRNVGQLLFAALDERQKENFIKLGKFASLTFSFAFGAVPGTWMSNLFAEKAVWACSLFLFGLAAWILCFEKGQQK